LWASSGDFSLVVDFKCKSGIAGKKVLAYDGHCTQLAAYANGLGSPHARCINLFIDTEVPGLIVTKEWTQPEVDQGWEAFKCLLKLWKVRRGIT
jgi:hypothetical protein